VVPRRGKWRTCPARCYSRGSRCRRGSSTSCRTCPAEQGRGKGFPIKDGAYNTATGQNPGIYPGANKVWISGFNGKPKNLWPKGEQIFNPIELDLTVAEGVNTKDFEVPASAGQNVRIVPTADPQ
jgi:hypothetical protein